MSARFARRNYGTGHGYRLDGYKIPGVTTAIGVLDKPALKQWAADRAAGEAVEHWDEIAELGLMQRYERIRKAHMSTVRKASVRGTVIHALGDKVSRHIDVEVPDEYRGPVEAYARFLDRWDFEVLHTETPICHSGHRYGGTFDGIATSPKLLDGQPIMLDVKTGKSVYREVALQLAAYRFADLAIIDDAEAPMPETAPTAYVAHVLEDDVELVPVDAGQGTWKTFLYALQIFRWQEACKDDPPVGRAIWPETVGADA